MKPTGVIFFPAFDWAITPTHPEREERLLYTRDQIFEEIEDREIALRLFRLLPKETAAEVFAYMDADVQKRIIEAITDSELRHILEEMYLDDYVDLVEEMPANVVQRVMRNTSRENRSLINQYLKYDFIRFFIN